LRKQRVLELLLLERPHALFLQEAPNTVGVHSVLKGELRDMGYDMHPDIAYGLITCVQRGLKIAPVQTTIEDADFRVQRLAWQIGDTRVLVRHRHAHSSSPSERLRMNQLFETESVGDLCLDIGDFNQHPRDSLPRGEAIAPMELTYRLQPEGEWVSLIDGAAISSMLAVDSAAYALDGVPGMQHRPVCIAITLAADFHFCRRWDLPKAVEELPWSSINKVDFGRFLAEDIDKAWDQWYTQVGVARPVIITDKPWGGWSIGANHNTLQSWWKMLRQAQQKCSSNADLLVVGILGAITQLLDEASKERLDNWKAAVRTRGGAARWVKFRLANAVAPARAAMDKVLFSAQEVADVLAPQLAARWNV
jgi:hypothetical protein